MFGWCLTFDAVYFRSELQAPVLGHSNEDNLIQSYHFWRYIVGYTVAKFKALCETDQKQRLMHRRINFEKKKDQEATRKSPCADPDGGRGLDPPPP